MPPCIRQTRRLRRLSHVLVTIRRMGLAISDAATAVEGATSDDVLLRQLERALKQSWGRETSYDPIGWTTTNPAWGQCAVTSLVVQDFLGGEVLRAVAGELVHYWNRTAAGHEVDLTICQFEAALRLTEPATPEDRAVTLAWPETARRYELLRSRVADLHGLPR